MMDLVYFILDIKSPYLFIYLKPSNIMLTKLSNSAVTTKVNALLEYISDLH